MAEFLKRAVVIEVIGDIKVDREELKGLAFLDESSGVDNIDYFVDTLDDEEEQFFLRAPRNSIIAKVVSEGSKSRGEPPTLFYPFFSSHIMMPIKPGEQVWVFQDEGKRFSYWMSRVHEPLHVEDPNYTHGDRRGLPTIQPPTTNIPKDNDGKEIKIDRMPTFQNGSSWENRDSDNPDFKDHDAAKWEEEEPKKNKMTFQSDRFPPDTYEEIVAADAVEPPKWRKIDKYEGSIEKDRVVYEPVPRFTKRPGDLVIQGSNNTLISLGTERGYSLGPGEVRPDPEKSNAKPEFDNKTYGNELTEGMGAIDIVTGRGRLHDGAEAAGDKADPAGDLETRPRVVKNRREYFETDKNRGLDEKEDKQGLGLIDVCEGDPDMKHDASRIYLSMKSSPDDLLGLVDMYPDLPLVDDDTNAPNSTHLATDAASIIIKSDEIRIVARQDTTTAAPIQGSIRLIKEGTPDDEAGEGRGIIMIEPNGTIFIDGPKIVIGSGIKKGKASGAGNQVAIGLGAEESLLMGQTLLEMIKALEKTFNDHFHPSGTGPTDKPTTPSKETWDNALSEVAKTL